MTTTNTLLIASKYAENSQTDQYIVDQGSTIIDVFTATNNGVVNASLAVNLVADGDLAGSDNLIVTKTIAPGDDYTFPEIVGQLLLFGGIISTIASAASTLTIRASGRNITD